MSLNQRMAWKTVLEKVQSLSKREHPDWLLTFEAEERLRDAIKAEATRLSTKEMGS